MQCFYVFYERFKDSPGEFMARCSRPSLRIARPAVRGVQPQGAYSLGFGGLQATLHENYRDIDWLGLFDRLHRIVQYANLALPV